MPRIVLHGGLACFDAFVASCIAALRVLMPCSFRDDVKELRISSDHGAVLRLSAQGTVGADRVRD